MLVDLFIALALLLQGEKRAQEPFRALDFEAACAAAATESKVVLVDFFTVWCGPCKRMDKLTWADPEVQTWLAEKTVPVKLDAEKETALARKFRVEAYPTVVLVDPRGKELGRLVGFQASRPFLAEAAEILSGVRRSDELAKQLEATGWEQPRLRLEYADELAHEGRLEDAFSHYFWCLDHGAEHDPGFAAENGRLIVGKIVLLGRGVPAIADEVRKRREALRALLVDGRASVHQAAVYAAINEHLGQTRLTLETYDELAAAAAGDDPRTAARAALFDSIVDNLLKAKRYDDILAHVGDPVAFFERERAALEQAAADPDLTEKERERRRNWLRRALVEKSARIFEALLGAGREDQARALLAGVLAFDSEPMTRKTFGSRARRVGREEWVKHISEGKAE